MKHVHHKNKMHKIVLSTMVVIATITSSGCGLEDIMGSAGVDWDLGGNSSGGGNVFDIIGLGSDGSNGGKDKNKGGGGKKGKN